MTKIIASVVIPNIGDLDYLVPNNLLLSPGDLVIVPFRNKKVIGLIWVIKNDTEIPYEKIKFVEDKIIFRLSDIHTSFIKWISEYYLFNLGSVFKLFLPTQVANYLIKGKKANLTQTLCNISYNKPNLNLDQEKAVNEITEKFNSEFKNILLHGVTGSGKTEVYLNIAADFILDGGQVLIILPEIALTNQIIDRIKSRFSYEPIIWHSSLTEKQRRENYFKILSGNSEIIIGARSALFLPYANLKMIIVDEEHDSSYKQEDGITYHARDMALILAKLANIPIILSSASPSLESINNSSHDKLSIINLTTRYNSNEMPEVHILDMKNLRKKGFFIAPPLIELIKSNIEKNQQSLLFINKKGYSPTLICAQCGTQKTCNYCSCSMVYHKSKKKMKCHQCGYECSIPKLCSNCKSEESYIPIGPGIERIKEEIEYLIPNSKIICLTQESFYNPLQANEILASIHENQYNIILGTQIIAKGHHFPALTLVGVIDADSSLMAGDLRSAEKTFQLLHQVGGRAGREINNSNIYIQTYNPEHPIIQSLVNYDEKNFVKHELQHRRMMDMPPFSRLCAIIISSKYEQKLIDFVAKLVQQAPVAKEIKILGPAPAMHYKIRGKFRYRILLKCKKNVNIQHYVKHWLKQISAPSFIHIKIDIDPYYFH